MKTIIPQAVRPPLHVGPLAYVLARTEPELWALSLPGESFRMACARWDAAADIVSDLLIEAGCEGHCCCCGGDGQMGSGACPVCGGSGKCGCR